jgi:hypothetical protein
MPVKSAVLFWDVYLIRDPDTKEVVYVGRSFQIGERVKNHIWNARSKTGRKGPLQIWILNLLSIGKRPEFIIAQSNIPWELGAIWEKVWMLTYYFRGAKLLNKEYNYWEQLEEQDPLYLMREWRFPVVEQAA